MRIRMLPQSGRWVRMSPSKDGPTQPRERSLEIEPAPPMGFGQDARGVGGARMAALGPSQSRFRMGRAGTTLRWGELFHDSAYSYSAV